MIKMTSLLVAATIMLAACDAPQGQAYVQPKQGGLVVQSGPKSGVNKIKEK